MSDSHTRQIADGQVKSLIRAGIPKTFHSRRISGVAGGDLIVKWLRDNPRQDISEGKGWSVVGVGAAAYDVMMLTALSLHMSNTTCMVIPLSKLVSAIHLDTEDAERASEAHALFVTDFYQVYPGGKLPLTGWQILTTETFLKERITSGKSTFLQFASYDEGVWWSKGFLQLVSNFNRQITVL